MDMIMVRCTRWWSLNQKTLTPTPMHNSAITQTHAKSARMPARAIPTPC